MNVSPKSKDDAETINALRDEVAKAWGSHAAAEQLYKLAAARADKNERSQGDVTVEMNALRRQLEAEKVARAEAEARADKVSSTVVGDAVARLEAAPTWATEVEALRQELSDVRLDAEKDASEATKEITRLMVELAGCLEEKNQAEALAFDSQKKLAVAEDIVRNAQARQSADESAGKKNVALAEATINKLRKEGRTGVAAFSAILLYNDRNIFVLSPIALTQMVTHSRYLSAVWGLNSLSLPCTPRPPLARQWTRRGFAHPQPRKLQPLPQNNSRKYQNPSQT